MNPFDRVKQAGSDDRWIRVGFSALLASLWVGAWVFKVHYVGQGFGRGKLSWAEIFERADTLILWWVVGTCAVSFLLRISSNHRVQICRDCGQPHAGAGASRCPACNGILEPLKGFYRRHPQHAKKH
jgi:hypothetical protein